MTINAWFDEEQINEITEIINEMDKAYSDVIAKKIAKELEKSIEDKFRDALGRQPNKVICNNCGAELDITYTNVDGNNDLVVEVEPCDCVLAND